MLCHYKVLVRVSAIFLTYLSYGAFCVLAFKTRNNDFSTEVTSKTNILLTLPLYTDQSSRIRILERACTATEMIPTIEMISATEMTPNHHRNDTYSQSK